MRPRDTTPDAHAVQTAVFRRMSVARRTTCAAEMSEQARSITLAAIRRRHPEYDDQQSRHALFRLILGDDLFRRAWPGVRLLDP